MAAYVYMVTDAKGNRTYVGYTVNPERRIRQHCGELAGGARSTRGFAGGCRFAVLAGPFASKRIALSVEKCWKLKRGRGLLARSRKLLEVLTRPRPWWPPLLDAFAIKVFEPRLAPVFQDSAFPLEYG
jgi:predicted GIY-YIG superfamily endonuclease